MRRKSPDHFAVHQDMILEAREVTAACARYTGEERSEMISDVPPTLKKFGESKVSQLYFIPVESNGRGVTRTHPIQCRCLSCGQRRAKNFLEAAWFGKLLRRQSLLKEN